MQCEPVECQKLELLHSYTKMVYSSVQLKASVAFLILYVMVFDCSSVPLYTNSTNSKLTPMNSTINVDYHQSAYVKNNLAADSTHNSRSFHRSKRSTELSDISSNILKWINYLANCVEENYSKCLFSCSDNNSEVSCFSAHIHLYT
jgi:hypothetical protein